MPRGLVLHAVASRRENMAQHRGLRIGFAGFVIALVGAAAGFSGFEIDQRWLSITGYLITGAGVVVGFIGILYGWITDGPRAVRGGVDAARENRGQAPNKN